MDDLKCPACQDSITFWNFARAPSPYHLTCDRCKARLKIQKYSLSVICISVVATVVITVICLLFNLNIACSMGIFTIGAISSELVLYHAFRRCGVFLELRGPQRLTYRQLGGGLRPGGVPVNSKTGGRK
jgi:hypothetical protein